MRLNSIYIINSAANKIEKVIQNKKFDFIFSTTTLSENVLLLGINCGEIIYVDLSNDSVVESIKAHRLTVNAKRRALYMEILINIVKYIYIKHYLYI